MFPLLRSNISGTGVLLRIAEALLAEVRAAGLCSLGTKRFPSNDADVLSRVGFTLSFLRDLELAVDLRFAGGCAPYLFNNEDWPEGADGAGYVSEDTKVRPSHLLKSYWAAWVGQAKFEEEGWLYERPLRAAAWRAQEHGLDEGLCFLLDLQSSGFVLEESITRTSMLRLLDAADRAQPGQAVTEVLFGTKLEPDGRRWPYPKYPEVEPDDLPGEAPHAAALEQLIKHALRQAEATRNASNYDGWLLGQWAISSEVAVVQSVLDHLHENRSVALKAVLDQLEEMRADAGGLKDIIRTGFAHPLLAAFPVFRTVYEAYEEQDPINWKHRIMVERALIPNAIASQILDGAFDEIPDTWGLVSPRIAAAVARNLPGRETCLIRADREAWRDDSYEALVRLDELVGPDSLAVSSEVVESLERLKTRFPWCDFVRLELGIALDEAQKPEQALRELEAAIMLRPNEQMRWRSLGIVLARLCEEDESSLALVVSEALGKKAEQRERV